MILLHKPRNGKATLRELDKLIVKIRGEGVKLSDIVKDWKLIIRVLRERRPTIPPSKRVKTGELKKK